MTEIERLEDLLDQAYERLDAARIAFNSAELERDRARRQVRREDEESAERS